MNLTSILYGYCSMDNGAFLGGACIQGKDKETCERNFWDFIEDKYGLSNGDIYITYRRDVTEDWNRTSDPTTPYPIGFQNVTT